MYRRNTAKTVGFLGILVLVVGLSGAASATEDSPPPAGPLNDIEVALEELLDRLGDLEATIDELSQAEPLSQVVSRAYENRDDDDTYHEVSSSGPMLVHVCGELVGAGSGRVRFAITKDDVRVRKQIIGDGVEDADCLTVGAEPYEVLTVFLGVGGSTELNTIITVQSTPSAVILINDLPDTARTLRD
jgi:hypothetical protein